MKKLFALVLLTFAFSAGYAQSLQSGDPGYTEELTTTSSNAIPEGPGTANCPISNVLFSQITLSAFGPGWNSTIGTAGQFFADNFSLASASVINSVCFTGSYAIPSSFNASAPFVVTYYADNAGSPGTILAGPFTSGATSSPTGGSSYGVPDNCYFLTHPDVNIPAGTTYWISIASSIPRTTSSNFGDHWRWKRTTDGTAGPNYYFLNGSGTWSTVGTINENMVFSLGGTLPGPPVPTMSEWGLILLGLSFLGFASAILYRRKKKLAIS